MLAKKFTFKKEPRETGSASVGHPHPDTIVKLHGKKAGCIAAPNWTTKDDKWGVRLVVEDVGEHCGWRWIALKRRFDTEPEAREWLNAHFNAITERFTLHTLED